MLSGAWKERVHDSWLEIRENPARALLQTLGIMLGVASVLGGFSITDSFRKVSEERWVKMGGMDKLNVQPNQVMATGSPTALEMANLGLRTDDAIKAEGQKESLEAVQGVSVIKNARARVRSEFGDAERALTGMGLDSAALEGFEIGKGRMFSSRDLDDAAPVAILGSEAAQVFFPSGEVLGQVLSVGNTRVQVIGLFKERVFRFREGDRNIFRRQNRVIALPATFIQKRLMGDGHARLDRIVFKVPDLNVMEKFTQALTGTLKSNHRQQEDFRLDDVASRVRKFRSQGDAYNLIFLLSGVLALVGGGIVNINIQLATLKERVREVGVKMAIGASSLEIFKSFMLEAMLLTVLGALLGLVVGVIFSFGITQSLKVPLFMTSGSFVWAFIMAGLSGFCFALYPAWKASRQSPMEALRYE